MQGDDGWCITDHSLRLRGGKAEPRVKQRNSRGGKKFDKVDGVITIGKRKDMDLGEVEIIR